MIDTAMSAITFRAHAQRLRWSLERSEDDPTLKIGTERIRRIINRAEHLAGLPDRHDEEDGCPICRSSATAQPRRSTTRRWLNLEAAWQLLHTAEESLLTIAPDEVVLARAPSIDALAKRWLGTDDERRKQIARLLPDNSAGVTSHVVSVGERCALETVLHAVHCTWDRSYARVRSFRNLVLTATVLLLIGVAGLVAVGYVWPQSLPMCTAAGAPVCATGFTGPTSGDVALIALIGAIAAGFSAVAGIAHLRPLVDPYQTPVVQGLLKVPTGAFTALLGVLAVEQGLQASAGVPASQGGMLFLAFVFGYSQQLVTRFVDAYGSEVRAALAEQQAHGPRANTA